MFEKLQNYLPGRVVYKLLTALNLSWIQAVTHPMDHGSCFERVFDEWRVSFTNLGNSDPLRESRSLMAQRLKRWRHVPALCETWQRSRD